MTVIRADGVAVVAEILVTEGDSVAAGDVLLRTELMKMQHDICAPAPGRVARIHVAPGQELAPGEPIVTLAPAAAPAQAARMQAAAPAERPDMAEFHDRMALLRDEARPKALERRHAAGFRTARENVADLCDDGSFVEYGALAVAAQRSRRDLAELQEKTPADGIICGTGTVAGRPIAVMAVDYTVLAGTQGYFHHKKMDRLLDVAARDRLPVVVFAEGGGGRPNDHDVAEIMVAGLNVPTFRRLAVYPGQTIGIAAGFCFAGNAALFGVCNLRIATRHSWIGMGGPAMIEGGGLGVFAPTEIGPAEEQAANGVIDLLVADEAAAVAATRDILALSDPGARDGRERLGGSSRRGGQSLGEGTPAAEDAAGRGHMPARAEEANGAGGNRGGNRGGDQGGDGADDGACGTARPMSAAPVHAHAPARPKLRDVVPAERTRAYDLRGAIDALADPGSVIELRRDFAPGMITALARIADRAVGLMANNPLHLGGAIDAPAADKGARFMQLCDAWALPLVTLCDTPGFMVGPETERQAQVAHVSRLFLAGARFSQPMVTIILRKAYGLGAMAMAGGGLDRPDLCCAWPTGEVGAMGLEGAVRLGYRDELAAIDDAEERERTFNRLVDGLYQRGKALSAASLLEFDTVIDPAETPAVICAVLDRTGPRPGPAPFVDAW